MSAAEHPRLVRYETPSAFLRAALPFDTWHMSIALGTSLQFFVEIGDSEAEPGQPHLWLAIWTGHDLDITLVRTSTMVTLCSPKHSTSLSPDWLAPRMQLLASSLYSLISSGAQPAMTSITGATALTSAFTPLYASLSGIAPDGPAVMETLHTHCPRARVDLKPPRLPEGHAIHVVQRGDKIALAQLAKLLQDFRAHHGGPGAYISLEQATKQAEVGIRFNEFMVYSVTDAEGKEEYAGYVRDGRITSKHTSVRNVFILPHHRRKGIAEVLTRAAVVRMLSQPNRMKEALASLLPAGADCTIDDAQIFAEKSNLSAQGIYSRVGYGFPAGEWDEEDGKSWEDCVELGYPGNPGH